MKRKHSGDACENKAVKIVLERFQFPLSITKKAPKPEPISYNPITLGKFSLTKDKRKFSDGGSVPAIKKDVPFPIDLNVGFSNWTDSSSEVPTLDPLLHWVCHNNFSLDNVDVLTYRGLLKKISMTKFDSYKNHWCVRLTKVNKSIIMDEIETEDKKKAKLNDSRQQKLFQYYGHKFEECVLKIESDSEVDIVVTSKLGKLRYLFAAEVDGVNADGEIVELKTHRVLQTEHHKKAFRQSKLLNTFLQCYIAGIKETGFGFRDNRGFVKHIKYHSTDEVESICKGDWNKNDMMQSLNKVMDWAVSLVKPGKVYHMFYNGQDKIELIEVDNISYIPDWFTDHANKGSDSW